MRLLSAMRRGAGQLRSVGNLAGLSMLLCGFLLQLSLGCLFTFGNLTTYVTSYLKVQVGQDVGYAETLWIGSVIALTEGFTLSLGSALYNRYGPRLTILIGSLMVSLSTAATYFTVQASLAWVIATYSVVNGLGVGLVYGVPLLVGYKWFPNRKGLVSGIVVGGYGLGGLLFTSVQTSFLNPDNVSPDDTDGFFHDEKLLDRVPRSFVLQAGIGAVLQLIGLICIHNPAELVENPVPVKQYGSMGSSSVCKSEWNERTGAEIKSVVPQGSEVYNITWKEAIKCREFYQLLMTFLLNSVTIGFISPLWKSFGQTFIKDDHFLALVGSGSSVFNMLGRLVWGLLCDLIGYKTTMILLASPLAVLFFTLTIVTGASRIMYLLWIWLIFFVVSGNFSVVVTGTTEIFGQKYAGEIYGIIFLGGALVAPVTGLAVNLLLDVFGYSLIFVLPGFFAIGSLVVTLMLKPHRPMELRSNGTIL